MNETSLTSQTALFERWFSRSRISRYSYFRHPDMLYEWDVELSKAFLQDIEHLEVLLRNFISARLAAQSLRDCQDECWYDHADHFNLDERFVHSIEKAKHRIRIEGHTPNLDRVVAALTFDTWRFLLIRRLEPTIWRAIRLRANGGTPHAPTLSRREFEHHVAKIYWLRNRCSHQEPLSLRDYHEEQTRIENYYASILWVAHSIDPSASDWITRHSRIRQVRSLCPRAIPTADPSTGLELCLIDESNVLDVISLDVKSKQREFVASNAVSLSEAYASNRSGGIAVPFCLKLNDQPIGFLMIGYDCVGWKDAPRIARGNYVLWRLMIDERFQESGFGRAAMRLALAYVRNQPAGPASHVWLSYEKENEVAEHLYHTFGFVETGELDGEEIIAARHLFG